MSFSPHLLVADDLTGAADCAAYAPALGLRAAIYLHALPPVCADDLQVVSTNSRALRTPDARSALLNSLTARGDIATMRCFKKIDSQLRGNVGAELEAMLERVAASVALVCPALPAQGRSVVDGRMVGTPSGDAHGGTAVGQLLAARTTLPQAHIHLKDVRRSQATLHAALQVACTQARLICADAQTDGDLDALVAAWRSAVPNGLLCGSAGLAAAWLRAIAPPNLPPLRPLESIPPVDLVVVGSASTMAHAQIATAAALPNVAVVALTSDTLPAIAAGKRPILHLPSASPALSHAAPMAGARRLANAAFTHMQRAPVQHVFVVGGDTAQAFAARLELTHLNVLNAAMPGMPTCAAPRANGARLWITLKAGNHGDAGTLAHLMQG